MKPYFPALNRNHTAGLFLLILTLPALSQPFQLDLLTAPQPWQRLEIAIRGVPAMENPFDPDKIRVEGTFHMPSGKVLTVPCYWHQPYQRSLSGANEILSASGEAGWRLRFAPPESGDYSVSVSVSTNGQTCGFPTNLSFTVSGDAPERTGYVGIDAHNRYFQTGDGQPLRLNGANYCWHGSRGTYDYDEWFAALQSVHANYVRLWMCPWSFGLETEASSLNRYRMDRAWQLDYVLQLAEARGIYVELCLDYHGMFATEPDYWGGNNYWPRNPYNITNSGPCLNPNGFFTNTTAKTIYQKRLRYLIARYGYSPNLLAWQFFNEIDNVFSLLNPASVRAWHAEMGDWTRANDPFDHLITTSFTSVDADSATWDLPQMDYVCVHSYGATKPATALNSLIQTQRQKHGKPVLIDEYGTSWQGWKREADPFLRGFRQGLWGGALGGSVGCSMSWWWQNIHSENLYSVYASLGSILNRTGWGSGSWTNLSFNVSSTPPATVGNALSNGQPFSVTLPLSSSWGAMLPGQLAVPDPGAASFAPSVLNCFVHGSSHADLRIPFRLSAWFTNNARLVMHLNSVSWNPILVVRVDGVELYRTNLPNPDGYWAVTNEYNIDFAVNLPAGKRTLEIFNAGADWFYLDWVRLEQVLPSTYLNQWEPPCEPIGLAGAREALLYVVAPGTAFPESATNAVLPVQRDRSITLTNWPEGNYIAEWYDPATANRIGSTRAVASNSALVLPLPDFNADLAGILYPPPHLRIIGREASGAFNLKLNSETGGRYSIQTSSNLSTWITSWLMTNQSGTRSFTDSEAAHLPLRFYRAKQQE